VDDDSTGRRIGRYEVERELAEGGMGVVYLALQPELERRVVLKRKRRDLADEEEAAERFLREARTAAAIHHPNVVCVYDCFTWRGETYIACEYVDGLDAASALAKAGPFPPRIAALVALEIAHGLEELHARGFVHRDLKPDNVLLGRGGEVKIADFGIAHDPKEPALTRTGVSIGTPDYMSPEQLRGERVDDRSDVFALGAVLYELVSGKPPFQQPDPGDSQAEPSRLLRIEQGRFVPLRSAARGTPRALARITSRCLRANPRRRIGSAAELRRRLERHLGAAWRSEHARREIAEWLAQRDLLPARGKTKRAAREKRPVRSARKAGWRRRAVGLALAAAIGALLFDLAFGSSGVLLGLASEGAAHAQPDLTAPGAADRYAPTSP
jgi:eukaryotic-like serine/threonine-protein kinase